MARRPPSEMALPVPGSLSDRKPLLRHILVGIVSLLVVLLTMLAFSRLEQFVIADGRFTLPGPPEPGSPSPHLRIEGARNTSDQQVSRVFARDFGRSLYLCPISQRRIQLMGISWVKDATVQRVWPNSLVVRITERTPVAFVQMGSVNNAARFGLIDEEGVLLESQRALARNLPVMLGVQTGDTREIRAQRVSRMLRLQKDCGDQMSKISEIDVADLENLRVAVQADGRVVTLMLGNQKFRQRLDNFLNNYQEIKKRLPHAVLLDCRLPDRITAVEESNGG